MLKEFKEFALKGNVIDMSVGVIIGGAFGKIVSSFTNDVLMPPIGLLLGNVDFSEIFFNLRGGEYNTLAEAQAAGAPTLNLGVFLNTVLDFLIMAFVIFLIVKQLSKLTRRATPPPPASAPTNKECPYCLSSIPLKASRCGHCTSDLKAA